MWFRYGGAIDGRTKCFPTQARTASTAPSPGGYKPTARERAALGCLSPMHTTPRGQPRPPVVPSPPSPGPPSPEGPGPPEETDGGDGGSGAPDGPVEGVDADVDTREEWITAQATQAKLAKKARKADRRRAKARQAALDLTQEEVPDDSQGETGLDHKMSDDDEVEAVGYGPFEGNHFNALLQINLLSSSSGETGGDTSAD